MTHTPPTTSAATKDAKYCLFMLNRIDLREYECRLNISVKLSAIKMVLILLITLLLYNLHGMCCRGVINYIPGLLVLYVPSCLFNCSQT